MPYRRIAALRTTNDTDAAQVQGGTNFRFDSPGDRQYTLAGQRIQRSHSLFGAGASSCQGDLRVTREDGWNTVLRQDKVEIGNSDSFRLKSKACKDRARVLSAKTFCKHSLGV